MKTRTVIATHTTIYRSDSKQSASNRPTHVLITALDPWDETELCSSLLPYNCRKSAEGFYRKAAARISEAAKVGAPQIVEMREPLVTIELLYAS